jgi:hypothetical protein
MLDEPGTKISSFPQQDVDRSRGEPAFLPQPCLILIAHLSTKTLASIDGRSFRWPALQREFQQRMDSRSGNAYPIASWSAAMTLAKLSNRKAQISRYVGRRDRFESNFAFRQIRKKVVGIAAIVMNCNSVISLSSQSIVKLRDKGLYPCGMKASSTVFDQQPRISCRK